MTFEQNLKLQSANANLVARFEDLAADKSLTVHKRTVAALQIANRDSVRANPQQAVLAAHQITIWAKLAFVAAADEKLRRRNAQPLARMLPRKDLQDQSHR
jgi:hypothetical protein